LPFPVNVDFAVIGIGVDRWWNDAVQHERLQYVSAQIRVGAPVLRQDPHLELVGDTLDAGDALGVLLRLALLPEASDGPRAS
jgi:hypothetical protein